LVFDGLLAAAGLQKLVGWFGGPRFPGTAEVFEQLGYRPGTLFALAAGVLEFVGGTLLLLGLFTPLATSIVVGVMINAVSATLPGGLFSPTGYQLPLLYVVVGAAVACTGAGTITLDHRRP
jgi:putative oxidoreductase